MDSDPAADPLYDRQRRFAPLGTDGQRALAAGRALVVGVGGMGSWLTELLARAGVGFVRLVDDDKVDITNLHRQAMYDQADARAARPKAQAAAAHVTAINPAVAVEPHVCRLERSNIAALAGDVDVILDGTDCFDARFLINDFAVKTHRPWVFAGVVGAEAQTMTIVPGRTACLRCVLDAPPPPHLSPTCRDVGVLGPAVAAIASIEAVEAVKILAGRVEAVSPYLTKIDLWANTLRRIDTAAGRRDDCPCCRRGRLEFLQP